MTWIVANAHTAFRRHADDLDDLNATHYASHPLFDSAFVGALTEHYADRGVLMAIDMERQSARGVTLLSRRGPAWWQTFLPAQTQVSPVVIAPDCAYRELLRSLPGVAFGIDWLCQDSMLSLLTQPPRDEDTEITQHALTMNVSLRDDFDTYWAERSKMLRKNIARYWRRAASDGITSRLEIITRKADLTEALGRYGALESAGWKGEHGTAIHADNEQGKFYLDVLNRFADKDRARIYELRFDTSVAASRICVHSDEMLIILKTTYDESLSRFAPGRLLLHALLEHEFAEGQFKSVEFYTNATSDQLSWATASRPIMHVTQYRTALLGASIRGARAVRARLTR